MESSLSPDYTIKEHGWFHDTDLFRSICETHPTPSGATPEAVFIDWRDSLLVFLNTNHSGGQWIPIDQ